MTHLQANANDDQARSALAAVSSELGNPAETVQVLHPLVARHPQNASLLTRYGVALSKAGRHADAIKVLTRANTLQSSAETLRALDEATRLSTQEPREVPRPAPAAVRNSLATDLDSADASSGPSDQVRGELLQLWHRRISSYRRFWLGMLILVVGAVALIVKIQRRKAPVSESMSVPRFLHSAYPELGLGLLLGVILLVTALISARFTRYKLYEHRIDFERGVLSQVRRPVWLFDITAVSLQRPPILTLTHTARIVVEHDTKAGKPSQDKLVAIGGVGDMAALVEKLQGISLRERRAMKKMWI
jgi:hypothetical protein